MTSKRAKAAALTKPTSPSYPHLQKMWVALQGHGERTPTQAYEDLLEILADVLRIRALPEDKRTEAASVILGVNAKDPEEAPIVQWFRAWVLSDDPQDDLGLLLMTEIGGNERLGQILTPVEVAKMMVMMNINPAPEDGHRESILDPCVGSGRFLMEWQKATVTEPTRPFLLCAIDLDVRMVRATIINLTLTNLWRVRKGAHPLPFRVLHADALMTRTEDSAAWAHANEPDWRTLPNILAKPPVTLETIAEETEVEEAPPTILEIKPSKQATLAFD